MTFLNDYNYFSKSSPEKSGGLDMKHKQVQHVLEHFDTWQNAKKFLSRFLEKNFSSVIMTCTHPHKSLIQTHFLLKIIWQWKKSSFDSEKCHWQWKMSLTVKNVNWQWKLSHVHIFHCQKLTVKIRLPDTSPNKSRVLSIRSESFRPKLVCFLPRLESHLYDIGSFL